MPTEDSSTHPMTTEIDIQIAVPLDRSFTDEIGENPEDFIKTVCNETIKSEADRVRLWRSIYISIVLTDDAGIQEINSDFREIDRPTDVLSFPQFEPEYFTDTDDDAFQRSNIPAVLGDVVVSSETVFSQAQQYGHSVKRELAYVVVHGLLHLLGYDHEDEADRRWMREREERVMSRLQLER